MNVAEYIVNVLKENQIHEIFGYQGGNITYMIDAVSRAEGIAYIQTYHEQGAAFAANAYAQVTRNFGVAVASSGPGAINMINGIANAYYDSIPCLFITGNINTAAMRESECIRQNGFQEADITGMVSGITKYAVTIRKAQDIRKILSHVLAVMKEGRPGPVLLDIPHNIQRTDIGEQTGYDEEVGKCSEVNNTAIAEIYEKLSYAKKPVILLGGGSRSIGATELINKTLERWPMPVVASLCGIDSIDNEHACYRGMIGSYALPAANRILEEADFVLVLGSRMDERQRAVNLEDFLAKAVVVHVEIDENEIGHIRKDEIGVNTTVECFLRALLQCQDRKFSFASWLKETKEWIQEITPEKAWIFGSSFKKRLLNIIGIRQENMVICVDVGNHQMAVAQAVKIAKNARYLNSAGLGSMGYALPAAIGAYYGAREKRVVCIAGDGGFMMNLQELQVVAREKIPIMMIVINNHGLGMIENYQKFAFEGRFYGSKWGYEAPDFGKIAAAFGISYMHIGGEEDVEAIKYSVPLLVEIEV